MYSNISTDRSPLHAISLVVSPQHVYACEVSAALVAYTQLVDVLVLSSALSALRPGSDMTWFQGLRMMFYFITPNESSFATPGEVPDYLDKVPHTHAQTESTYNHPIQA